MFVLMGIMIVSAGILVSAKDEIGIVVNGENANMKVSPKIIDGVTMVPFRETMEVLQAKISWDANTKSIKATRKNKSVSIQVGSNIVKVGKQEVEIQSPPVVIDNFTYVPIRVISTGFGCKIRYDAINNNIVITDTALAKRQLQQRQLEPLRQQRLQLQQRQQQRLQQKQQQLTTMIVVFQEYQELYTKWFFRI